MLKKTTLILVLLCVALSPIAAFAEDGAATFKAKCAACHGADGKKMAKADLTSAAVQGKSNADLATFIGTNPKHNFKSKGLTEETINAVVAFIKTLK